MRFARRNFVHAAFALLLSSSCAINAFAAEKNPQVVMKTSMGEITLELYSDKAPKTVENFLNYAKNGHYKDTIFHRVINGFMVQGGGFDKDMNQKPSGASIQNEAKNGLKNDIYTVSMARTMDPHSASAQFFVNVKNNSFLDYPGQDGWGYTVFGKIVKGTDIIDKIKAVPVTSKGMHQDVPVKPVLIESVSVVK